MKIEIDIYGPSYSEMAHFMTFCIDVVTHQVMMSILQWMFPDWIQNLCRLKKKKSKEMQELLSECPTFELLVWKKRLKELIAFQYLRELLIFAPDYVCFLIHQAPHHRNFSGIKLASRPLLYNLAVQKASIDHEF